MVCKGLIYVNFNLQVETLLRYNWYSSDTFEAIVLRNFYAVQFLISDGITVAKVNPYGSLTLLAGCGQDAQNAKQAPLPLVAVPGC